MFIDFSLMLFSKSSCTWRVGVREKSPLDLLTEEIAASFSKVARSMIGLDSNMLACGCCSLGCVFDERP